ncbi:MAG: DNA polymerase III subunit beta [Christensenellaceae bacterium]|jgi:DNA polymerase-3 subunit beta|nr:DNA polymerase III subunit beta [Christensenellaceae bacterium]
MNFKCSTTDLANAATIVSKALPARAIPPMSTGIFLKASGKTVTLTASNYEFTIKKEINASVKIEGEVLVDGKTFAEFIKKVSCSDVELEENSSTHDENTERRLKITYNDTNVLYLYCLTDKYPIIEDNTDDYDFEVSQSDFKETIERGMYCASTEDSRPSLKGCFLETRDDSLLAVSLDGYRMAIVKCGIKEKKNNLKALIFAKTLSEIVKVIDNNEEELKIKATKNMFFLKNGSTSIIIRVMELEFYEFDGIIPKDVATEITISKELLEKCIDRVSLMCKTGNDCLKIEVGENKITVSTKTDVADIKEVVSCEKTGGDLIIAFNNRFLKDALAKCKDQTIRICIPSPVKPVTIAPLSGDKFKHIVLPIRL